MADLGRGALSSWSQAKWDGLDAIAKQHFDAAVVFAKTWAARHVAADTASVRVAGADVPIVELTSPQFVFIAGVLTDHDLEQMVMGAAARLALVEDTAVLGVLVAAAVVEPVPYAATAAPFARAEATFRAGDAARPPAGNLELAAFVGHDVHADLDSVQHLATWRTVLGHLETRFGAQLGRSVALNGPGVRGIVTSRSPKPIEIVRTDQPRLRVVGLAGRAVTLELLVEVGVGPAIETNVVVVADAGAP